MGALVLSAALTALYAIGGRALRPLRRAVRTRVEQILWITGAGKAIAFYRHFAFDLPRATTALGVALLVGIATVRLFLLAHVAAPAYLQAYFVLVAVFALLAAAAASGIVERAVPAGWAIGSLVALASMLMYIASRAWGLPDLPNLVDRWDNPLGTFSIMLAAGYLGLHFSVLTRMTVAYPHRQGWTD